MQKKILGDTSADQAVCNKSGIDEKAMICVMAGSCPYFSIPEVSPVVKREEYIDET
jgi:hypothetical protein